MLTDIQKESRVDTIGSSDAPIVCGASPYSSPLELYYKLHGELPRYTDEETRAQKFGSRLEPAIAEIAAEELGVKIRRSAPRKHATYEFMSANLDYEIIGNPKGPGVLEIKNRGGDRPFDELPDDIKLQVAHQLAVTNRDWAMVAVLFRFSDLRTFEVERDKELEEYLIEIEHRFMLRVKQGQPPDHRWDAESVGLLRLIYPQDSGQTIHLPADAAINAQGFLDAKKSIEAAEETKSLYEGLLKEAIGSASVAELPGYKISWKTTKGSQKFDEDRFKADQPELYKQYLKTTNGYRRFLVKPEKGLVNA